MSALETALELIRTQRKATEAGKPLAARPELKRILEAPPEAPNLVTLALSASDLHERASVVDPNPTPAQAEALNYKQARISYKGMPITIEVRKGGYRRGVDKDGKPWENLLTRAHYGRFRGSEGADGEALDCYLCDGTGPGEHLDSDIAFVINQVDKDGNFNEHKIILACANRKAARDVYNSAYPPNWKGCGSIVALTIPQLKKWIEHGKTHKELPESTMITLATAPAIPAQSNANGQPRTNANDSAQPQPQQQPAALEQPPDPNAVLLAYLDALVDAESGDPHADQVADILWRQMGGKGHHPQEKPAETV